jgi:hypothetical protein
MLGGDHEVRRADKAGVDAGEVSEVKPIGDVA